MKDPSMVPQPIILTAVFDKDFLPSPLIRKPMKGSSGIRSIMFFIFGYELPATGCELEPIRFAGRSLQLAA